MTNEITITREEFMKVSARVSSRIVDSLAKEAEKEDGWVDSTMLVGQTLSHLLFSSELACTLFGAEQKGE
jgi:hypothetical protein